MASIFSTQNLQTFLRRKNFRPPPPGPLGRPPGGRPPGPEDPGPEPSDRELLGALGVLVSSAMMFLFLLGSHGPAALKNLGAGGFCPRRGRRLDRSGRRCRRLSTELLARGADGFDL